MTDRFSKRLRSSLQGASAQSLVNASKQAKKPLSNAYRAVEPAVSKQVRAADYFANRLATYLSDSKQHEGYDLGEEHFIMPRSRVRRAKEGEEASSAETSDAESVARSSTSVVSDANRRRFNQTPKTRMSKKMHPSAEVHPDATVPSWKSKNILWPKSGLPIPQVLYRLIEPTRSTPVLDSESRESQLQKTGQRAAFRLIEKSLGKSYQAHVEWRNRWPLPAHPGRRRSFDEPGHPEYPFSWSTDRLPLPVKQTDKRGRQITGFGVSNQTKAGRLTVWDNLSIQSLSSELSDSKSDAFKKHPDTRVSLKRSESHPVGNLAPSDKGKAIQATWSPRSHASSFESIDLSDESDTSIINTKPTKSTKTENNPLIIKAKLYDEIKKMVGVGMVEATEDFQESKHTAEALKAQLQGKQVTPGQVIRRAGNVGKVIAKNAPKVMLMTTKALPFLNMKVDEMIDYGKDVTGSITKAAKGTEERLKLFHQYLQKTLQPFEQQVLLKERLHEIHWQDNFIARQIKDIKGWDPNLERLLQRRVDMVLDVLPKAAINSRIDPAIVKEFKKLYPQSTHQFLTGIIQDHELRVRDIQQHIKYGTDFKVIERKNYVWQGSFGQGKTEGAQALIRNILGAKCFVIDYSHILNDSDVPRYGIVHAILNHIKSAAGILPPDGHIILDDFGKLNLTEKDWDALVPWLDHKSRKDWTPIITTGTSPQSVTVPQSLHFTMNEEVKGMMRSRMQNIARFDKITPALAHKVLTTTLQQENNQAVNSLDESSLEHLKRYVLKSIDGHWAKTGVKPDLRHINRTAGDALVRAIKIAADDVEPVSKVLSSQTVLAPYNGLFIRKSVPLSNEMRKLSVKELMQTDSPLRLQVLKALFDYNYEGIPLPGTVNLYTTHLTPPPTGTYSARATASYPNTPCQKFQEI